MKENFCTKKSMMKPLGLEYKKINISPNFCMLYNGENTNLSNCKTCGYARYKPNIDRERTLVAYKKLKYLPLIGCKCYLCLQRWPDT
jgi:hypothetical protein